MWLFRNEYPRKQSKRKTCVTVYDRQAWDNLLGVSLFVTVVYVTYWFKCPSPVAAPKNNFELLTVLSNYRDKEVAAAASTAINRHLWYLSEVLVGFAFF